MGRECSFRIIGYEEYEGNQGDIDYVYCMLEWTLRALNLRVKVMGWQEELLRREEAGLGYPIPDSINKDWRVLVERRELT